MTVKKEGKTKMERSRMRCIDEISYDTKAYVIKNLRMAALRHER